MVYQSNIDIPEQYSRTDTNVKLHQKQIFIFFPHTLIFFNMVDDVDLYLIMNTTVWK